MVVVPVPISCATWAKVRLPVGIELAKWRGPPRRRCHSPSARDRSRRHISCWDWPPRKRPFSSPFRSTADAARALARISSLRSAPAGIAPCVFFMPDLKTLRRRSSIASMPRSSAASSTIISVADIDLQCAIATRRTGIDCARRPAPRRRNRSSADSRSTAPPWRRRRRRRRRSSRGRRHRF